MNKEKIKKTILDLYKKDQDMRKKWAGRSFLWEESDIKTDKENSRKIKEIINSIGSWPTISEFGSEVSEAAWVLVQHIADDLPFRKKALQMMCALPEGEVDKKLIAKLIDRNLIFQGKPQLYGTSFHVDKKTDTLIPSEIKDIESIDKRRAEMGLDSFGAHKKRAFESYEELKKEK